MNLTHAQQDALTECPACHMAVADHTHVGCQWCPCELTRAGALHAAVERLVDQAVLAVLTAGGEP